MMRRGGPARMRQIGSKVNRLSDSRAEQAFAAYAAGFAFFARRRQAR